MKAKYIAFSLLALAATAGSFSLPVIYGRQVDSRTLDVVMAADADDYIENLTSIDTAERIKSLINAVEWNEMYGTSIIPAYSAEGDDIPEKTRTKIFDQLDLLTEKQLLPDMNALGLADNDMSITLFTLYTPENTHSVMRVNLDSIKYDEYENVDGNSCLLLIDPDTYCVYYCSFFSITNVMKRGIEGAVIFPTVDDTYFQRAAEYYSADFASNAQIYEYDSTAFLRYGDFGDISIYVDHADYSFSFGLNSIYKLFVDYGVDYYDPTDLVYPTDVVVNSAGTSRY